MKFQRPRAVPSQSWQTNAFMVCLSTAIVTEEKGGLRIMKHLFTGGIFLMISEMAFAVAYFLRHLLPKDLSIAITLSLVAIILVKMLDVEDRLFQ